MVTVPAPYDVLSGAGALVGSLFGVAQTTALSGADVPLQMDGVWELKKLSAQAWTVGVKIYWDNTNKQCDTTSAGNTLIGVATETAANPTAVGRVRLGIVA